MLLPMPLPLLPWGNLCLTSVPGRVWRSLPLGDLGSGSSPRGIWGLTTTPFPLFPACVNTPLPQSELLGKAWVGQMPWGKSRPGELRAGPSPFPCVCRSGGGSLPLVQPLVLGVMLWVPGLGCSALLPPVQLPGGWRCSGDYYVFYFLIKSKTLFYKSMGHCGC